MQVKICEHASRDDAASMRRLLQRQARVGIIANTVDVTLPVAPPKDVWLRWPRLQSSRRLRRGAKLSQGADLRQDEVLNGNLLQNFKNDLRAALGDKAQHSGHVQRLRSTGIVGVKAATEESREDKPSVPHSFLHGMASAAQGVTSFWQRLK